MSNRQTECNKCKANGVPNQMISFVDLGEDPYSGKKKWRLLDAGTDNTHQHKTNFMSRETGGLTERTGTYGDKHLSIIWFAGKHRNDLENWYNQFSSNNNVKFSQSHAVAIGDSIEYSICVYYEEEAK